MARKYFLYIFLFFAVVFPNSLRGFTIPFFVFVGCLSFFAGFNHLDNRALILYFLLAATSCVYILIGSLGVDFNAVLVLTFVYVFAPLVWMYFWSYLLSVSSTQQVASFILVCGAIAALTVFVFFRFYQDLGVDALLWIIAVPNIQLEDGRAAATMHVFGSLIFIVAAFFAAPSVVQNVGWRVLLVSLLGTAAFVSGRSGLVLSIFVGLLLNILNWHTTDLRRFLRLLPAAVLAICALLFATSMLSEYAFYGFDLDIWSVINEMLEKIAAAGGEDRVAQFYALLEGILNTWGLGAGHGANVPLIRNEDAPWKYELLWLSTVYHVGIIGFLIYALPAVLVVRAYVTLRIHRSTTAFDTFVFAGFSSICIASTTNPYLESFDFQWMAVFPCVYFYKRYTAVQMAATHISAEAVGRKPLLVQRRIHRPRT